MPYNKVDPTRNQAHGKQHTLKMNSIKPTIRAMMTKITDTAF
jgi:hypothetical protein